VATARRHRVAGGAALVPAAANRYHRYLDLGRHTPLLRWPDMTVLVKTMQLPKLLPFHRRRGLSGD
jgi:hypothetical protein